MNELAVTGANRKKILFLITKSNWGGAQRYVYDLAINLPTEKYDVSVAYGEHGELSEKLKEGGIRTIELAYMQNSLSPLTLIKVVFECIQLLRKERPDTLHTNSSVAGFVGAVAGRLTKTTNIVFTAHGWAFNEDRSSVQKQIFKTFHWLTVLLSHQTIAVSKAITTQMDWPFVAKKMRVINPGRTILNLKTKSEARGILETKVVDSEANLADYHKDIWVGTIAELHPIKRLHRSIDSIAAATRTQPNVRYIIIGDGQLRQELHQKVCDLGLEKHVFFTGSIHEAGRFLRAFDIFVLPSKSESFGYVLLEAGLAEVPIITTHVGGITDIITDQETGLLIAPDNTTALTEALMRLLTDKRLCGTLAAANYQNVQQFSLEKMCSETQALY